MVVSVGCVTRPIWHSSVRSQRPTVRVSGHAESIFSNTYGQTLWTYLLQFFVWSFLFELLISSRISWSCEANTHTHKHTIFLSKHPLFQSRFAVSESLNIDDFPVTQVAPMGSESFLPEIQATASLEPPKTSWIIGVANDTRLLTHFRSFSILKMNTWTQQFSMQSLQNSNG